MFTYSGSLDVSGLSTTPTVTTLGILPNVALLVFVNSSSADNDNFFDAITGPTSFGTGTGSLPNSQIGGVFSILGINGGFVTVPNNYISGTNISGSITFNSSTFASIGVTPGIYTYNLTNNIPNNDIVLNIGTPVPFEFSPVVGVSLLGGLWLGRKALKRKKSK